MGEGFKVAGAGAHPVAPEHLDSQRIELMGRNLLVSLRIRDGLEVARPEPDRGIDLIVYADRGLSGPWSRSPPARIAGRQLGSSVSALGAGRITSSSGRIGSACQGPLSYPTESPSAPSKPTSLPSSIVAMPGPDAMRLDTTASARASSASVSGTTPPASTSRLLARA